MKFNWDDFTKEDFVNYCAMLENEECEADDCIGAIRVGEICCDLVLREYETDEFTLTYDVYVGGEDTGYGYSAREALETGEYKDKYDVPDEEQYPYDYADGGDFPDSCISMTYEDFMRMAEEEISKFLTNNHLLDKANMPLHKW